MGDALRLRGGLSLRGSAMTRADTAIVWSVISVTCAASPVTFVTLPTSPPLSWSAAITGMSLRTPALEPLLMTIVAYQSVGDEPMTRAVTGFMAATPLLPSSASRLRSCAFSLRGAALGDELLVQLVALLARGP